VHTSTSTRSASTERPLRATGRRESPATYRRRRLVAILALVAVVTLLALAFSGGEGGAGAEAEPVRLTIAATGDLLIHSPVFERALALGGGSSYDFAPMFDEIEPWIRQADLALCHVETPMSDSIPPAGYPLFNTPPELADAIAATGWDACSTASDHTIDQGEEGVAATLSALDRAAVAHTGSYASEADSRRPLILEAGGARVALLAYTTDLNGLVPPAPWTVNVVSDPQEVIVDARRALSQGADAVLVNMHWGSEIVPEYVPHPSAEQRRFAAELARAPEITAIIGQGPHVVQTIARVNGKYVVFSEGNLISNQGAAVGLAEASQDGLIAVLDLLIDGEVATVEEVRYVPVWVSQPEYLVVPVGAGIEEGLADPATLAESYERTVSVAGRGDGIQPEPERVP
jgi:Bacterial capsule synthesis protein PGA_cap